jgi:hypothetical protein
MLDMFSDVPLDKLTSELNRNLIDIYPYYDISNIQKFKYDDYDYADWLLKGFVSRKKRKQFFNNVISNNNICFHIGGIRSTLFGSRNYITKCPLIFFDGKVDPVFLGNAHLMANSRIANFSCILFHFRFTTSFYHNVLEDVEKDIYNCDDYKRYFNVIKDNPNLLIKQPSAAKYQGLDKLIEKTFLIVSEDFKKWALS